MSLASIPLIELNKSVSAPLSGTDSHEASDLGDIFLNILTAPGDLKAKKGQIADYSVSEDAEKTENLAKIIAKLYGSDLLEESDLLLEGTGKLKELENQITAFDLQNANNKHQSDTNEKSVERQNQDVEALLSLIADFRKQITKIDENKLGLASSSNQELPLEIPTKKNGVEFKPMKLPDHSRTVNAVYPNETSPLNFSFTTPRIELVEITDNTEEDETLISLKHGVNLDSKSKSTLFDAGKAISSILEEEIVMRPVSEGLEKSPKTSTDIGSEAVPARPNVKDKMISSQITAKNISEKPLGFQGQQNGSKALPISNRETNPISTHTPEKELNTPKAGGHQNVEKASDKVTKQVSLFKKNERASEPYIQSIKETNVKLGPNERGASNSKTSPSTLMYQTTLNSGSDTNAYKVFAEDAFRLPSAKLSVQKKPIIGQFNANFAANKVADSFTRAINSLDISQSSKNWTNKVRIKESSFETSSARPITVQPNSSTSIGSNSPSLEMLEKWVDSQLDLNSRGWVSNLSKSMLSALSRGQQRLTFTLSPESLGKVNVTFAHGTKGLDIRINAERQATASLIGDAEAKLVANIEASGQRVASVTCSSSNSFENAYQSSQNSNSDANRENSNENRKSQSTAPDQSTETSDSTETVGKSNDDDTIINITI